MRSEIRDTVAVSGKTFVFQTLEKVSWTAFRDFYQNLESEVTGTFDPFGGDYSTQRVRQEYQRYREGKLFGIGVFDQNGRMGGICWIGADGARRPGFGLGLRVPFQGRGLGRRIMEICLSEGRRRYDIAGIWLTVFKTNFRALSLYKSMGFKILGECACRKRYDSFVMGLWFPPAPKWWKDRLEESDLEGREIFIIPYTHCDWAWCYSRQWHEERYADILRQVLVTMRSNPEFRWFMDSASEQFDALERCAPELMPEVRRLVREGRIGVSGGMVAICHPHRMDGETFIRNLTVGRRYYERRFPGLRLDTAVFYDVIGGHSQLPQLLAGCGYRFYRISRPEGFMFLRGIPALFRWKGADGTTLLSSIGHYDGFAWPESVAVNEWVSDWPRAKEYFIQKELRRRLPAFPGRQVWIPAGSDDQTPMKTHSGLPVDLTGLVAEWNRREETPVRFATPSEFLDAVEPTAGELPVWEGPLEMAGWTYWYSQIGRESLWRMRPGVERALLDAELWSSLSRGSDGSALRLDEEWWDYLAACAHATLWLFTEDYDALRERLRDAGRSASKKADAKQKAIARKYLTLRPGRDVVVWNRQSWDVDNTVSIHVVFPERGTRSVTLKNEAGKRVHAQATRARRYDDGTLQEADLVARVKVAGLSATAFEIVPSSGEENGHEGNRHSPEVVENDFIRAVFGEGGILELTDKSGNVDYRDVALPRFYHTPDRDPNPLIYAPTERIDRLEQTELKITEEGFLLTEVMMRGALAGHAVEARARVSHLRPIIEFETLIEIKRDDGDFRIGTALPFEGRLVADIPYGVEERNLETEFYGRGPADTISHDIERLEEGVFWALNWVDYSDGTKGFTFMAEPGTQGFRYVAQTRLLEHILHKAISHKTEGWMSHMHRCREGLGRQHFRYAVMLHKGNWRSAGLPGGEIEWAWPLEGCVWNQGACNGVKARSWSPVRFSSGHSRLTAIHRDGPDMVVRIVECVGMKDNARLECERDIASARKTDFLGKDVAGKLKLGKRGVSIAVGPWEICTLRLRTARKSSKP
ncbi:MAG TPA: GNAT family N-acetyltransferase [Candidatus Brocadiia bacterium]|nr:GNAT family N-acetyltransferase [Candidatus Brocadiia bacterium]